jgi:hypothetical protein
MQPSSPARLACVSVPTSTSGHAIVSLYVEHNSTSAHYDIHAAVLGASLSEHAPTDWIRLLMVSGPQEPRSASLERLVGVGWSTCNVPTLLPPRRPRSARWMYTFAKLQAFSLIQFRSVLVLDLDVLSVGRLPPSLLHVLESSPLAELAASQDIAYGRGHVPIFNSGIMMIKPSLERCDWPIFATLAHFLVHDMSRRRRPALLLCMRV